MTAQPPTRAQVLEAFGADDFAELTTYQAITKFDKVEDEINRRVRNGLDTEDQLWLLARLEAKIARDYEYDN
uniref:hypothetical protein n=1 Tax=Micromonospora sp. NBC_00855 TaxID=2975978 RepID=UPI00224DA6EA|nr:hypothetical protein OHB51_35265 [Micromonospora sp. NBC_00855]